MINKGMEEVHNPKHIKIGSKKRLKRVSNFSGLSKLKKGVLLLRYNC